MRGNIADRSREFSINTLRSYTQTLPTSVGINYIGSLCKSSVSHWPTGRCHALVVLAINPAWHLPAPGLSCMYQSLNCTNQYLMTAHVGVPAWHILPTGCFARWVCTPGTSCPLAALLGGCARLAHLAHRLLCLVGVPAWHILPTGCFAWWVCTPGTSCPQAALLGGCARLAQLTHWLMLRGCARLALLAHLCLSAAVQ